MDGDVTRCPLCDHPLRVPDSLLGQPVRCPECRSLFAAPVRAGGALTEPRFLPEPRPNGVPPRVAAPARGRPPRSLLGPALGLAFVGAVGACVFAAMLYLTVNEPDKVKEAARRQNESFAKALTGKPAEPLTAAELDAGVERAYWQSWLFLGSAAVTLAGAASMATRRAYPLAVAGAVAAMLPQPCCLLGLPFGVWALVVLLSPGVRATFR